MWIFRGIYGSIVAFETSAPAQHPNTDLEHAHVLIHRKNPIEIIRQQQCSLRVGAIGYAEPHLSLACNSSSKGVIPHPNTPAPGASPNYSARFTLLSLLSRKEMPELLALTNREAPPSAHPAMSALCASTVKRRGSSALCSSVVTCSEL
eukprot:CAMPEP_0194305490 /NCGR_PEP_ID=MMETSP0171-20130528/2916_1 /TAXON_ID=218684 /ORGANISM="Corethron pennatum, Strain L29A3" /LENGTH=148 /DNA_ID=CAMNT_0039057039 /DNA_START=983 /DNA_END=1426 /DNA_ORIENTATION=-